jgi:glycine cleavage system H protein
MTKLFDKFEYPSGLYYSKDHTWAKIEDGKVRVGMTDFAQQISGKVMFIRLKSPGGVVDQGKTLGTMETGKWVGPIKSPISGTILENNPVIREAAATVNDDPYGKGWLSVIQPSNTEELKGLMTEIDKDWLLQEMKKYGK